MAKYPYEVKSYSDWVGGLMPDAISLNEFDEKAQRFQVAGAFPYTPPKASKSIPLAFVWDLSGGVVQYKNLAIYAPDRTSQVFGLNNIFPSQIVGWAEVGGAHAPYLWEKKGTAFPVTNMGSLGGRAGEARDINDPPDPNDPNSSGQAVGWSHNKSGARRAFIWTRKGMTGEMRDLGTLSDNTSESAESEAFAINKAGQVVGWAHAPDRQKHAFLWTPGASDGVPSNPEMRDLGTFGHKESVAYDVNDSGHVVGQLLDSTSDGFFWTEEDGFQLTGSFGGNDTAALALNNHDHVVGYSRKSNRDQRAFIWGGGPALDLNTRIDPARGWRLETAEDINDRGDIVGFGRTATLHRQGFHLLPKAPVFISEDGHANIPVQVYPEIHMHVVSDVINILVGGRAGSSGVGIGLGGGVIPIDPHDPTLWINYFRHRDALLGLLMSELLPLIRNSDARFAIQRILLNTALEDIQKALASLNELEGQYRRAEDGADLAVQES